MNDIIDVTAQPTMIIDCSSYRTNNYSVDLDLVGRCVTMHFPRERVENLVSTFGTLCSKAKWNQREPVGHFAPTLFDSLFSYNQRLMYSVASKSYFFSFVLFSLG